MDRFTAFSLRNVSAIIILCILVVFGGIYSGRVIRKESMPDINIPYVTVVTVYPGASPGDILESVTKPLEGLVSGINGVRSVNSTSSENFSTIAAQFDYTSDMDEKAKLIEDAVKSVKLPENADAPKVMKVDLNAMPIMNIAVSNAGIPPAELEEAVKESLLPSLQGVEGVAGASLASSTEKAVYVRLLPERLKEYNLTSQTVSQLLQANNVSFPAGTLTMDGRVKPVRVAGRIGSLEGLKALRLPVMPNTTELMKSTFTQVGQGVATLGKAVGQVGQGVAGLGQAFNGQTKILGAIQETQGKLTALRITMSEARSVLANPQATEEAKANAEATVAQLTFTTDMLESALRQLRAKLDEVQGIVDEQIAGASNAKMPGMKGADGKADLTSIPAPGASPQAQTVALSQVAEVTLDSERTTSINRVDGKPTVVVRIVKNPDANTINVADGVKGVLDKARATLPEGTGFKVIADQSESVKESVNGMLREGYIGALFAFLVILLFLRNLRTTIIACISIPLSVLITMAFLKSLDITLNILTLGGLSVAIGRIVDDSIVVIENIFRHLQSRGKSGQDVLRLAVREVSSAITSSTLTTVAVFIPMGLVSGLAGVLFKPFALTVSIALLSSLLVAITVIPVLSSLLLLGGKGVGHREEEHGGRMIRGYVRLLTWSLNHRAVALGVAFVLLAGSLALLPRIGTSFMTDKKENYAGISITYPPGTDIAMVDATARKMERILDGNGDVESYRTTVGADGGGMGGARGTNTGSILIGFKDGVVTSEAIARVERAIEPLAGKAMVEVTEASPNGIVGVSSMNNLEVDVLGRDMATIRKAAGRVTRELAAMDGVGKVSNTLTDSKPEISVAVDQAKASSRYLSAAQVGMHIRELLNTNTVTKLTVSRKEMDVRLGLRLKDGTGIDDIRALRVPSPAGGDVALEDIADVREVPGPVSVYTSDGKEYARITAQIQDRDTGAVSGRIQGKLDSMGLPKGIETRMGGVSEMMKETFTQLGVAMVIAVFAVFFVMIVAMGELTAPLAILFSLPLAAIGGITMLFVTGTTLDMPALIGALMLIGIVVTNAIVLMDRVQQSRADGVPVREALVEAGQVRMRPILMTAIATIAALIPVALGFSEGSATSQSLAVIVIGGLTTSTFLTLIIVPVAYEVLLGWSRRILRSVSAE